MLIKIKKILAVTALLAMSGTASAVIIPFGVQNNISDATVSGWGFTQCYSSTYGASGDSISVILGNCTGSHLMLAARRVGTTVWDVLGAADFASVTTDTSTGNITTLANGIEWYYSPSWSWGFAKGGDSVSRTSCDTSSTNAAQRLCWHTGNGNINGGWRAGANTGLNGNNGWERSIFTANVAQVSSPSILAIFGLALVGFGLKRRYN